MTYVLETDIVERWIWNVVMADNSVKPGGTLGVHELANTQVIGSDPYPAIVYQPQAPMFDLKQVGMITIWATGLWTIKVIVPGRDYSPAKPIAARLHVLFDRSGGAVPGGGNIVECWRQDILQIPEKNQQSEDYRHLGGIYHIRAQQ